MSYICDKHGRWTNPDLFHCPMCANELPPIDGQAIDGFRIKKSQAAPDSPTARTSDAVTRQGTKSPGGEASGPGNGLIGDLHEDDVPGFVAAVEERDRRLARETLQRVRERVKCLGDAAYCDYINMMQNDRCLGVDAKLKDGTFTRENLQALRSADESLGKHRALAKARDVIDEELEKLK